MISAFLSLGECTCLDGFLPNIEKNHTLDCYQEHLKGPCNNNEKFELSEDGPNCIKNYCPPNETEINGICVRTANCPSDEYVKFDLNEERSFCDKLSNLHFENRQVLVVPKKCSGQTRENVNGNCQNLSNSFNYRMLETRDQIYTGCRDRKSFLRCRNCMQNRKRKRCPACRKCPNYNKG